MMSKIVRTISNILYAPIIIFGLYIIMHGHLTPGGGFQGGAVVASAFAMLVIAHGKRVKEWLKRASLSVTECSGLLAFIGLAFLGIGATFFYNLLGAGRSQIFGKSIPYGANPGYLYTGGTLPLMNLAVGAEVLAALGIIVISMAMGGEE